VVANEPAAAAAADPAPQREELPPPKLLTDDQVKSYIQNGFLALPVTDFTPEWHTALWQKCHDWVYGDEVEPQEDSRLVFPNIPELGEVLNSTVMRGALSSILGPDYVQHPHRTMHNYGQRNHEQLTPTGDQTWHKDGHHVPLRSHFPRWCMVFYYPCEVTEEMGPTGIIPGANYTTIDRQDRGQDFLEDLLEGFLDTVRACSGRLSALSVSHSESNLYGGFVWARRALNRQKRRFPARAGGEQGRAHREQGRARQGDRGGVGYLGAARCGRDRQGC
jgi:hypothetical protein